MRGGGGGGVSILKFPRITKIRRHNITAFRKIQLNCQINRIFQGYYRAMYNNEIALHELIRYFG